MNAVKEKEPFFSRDREFYKTLFRMTIVVALQNLVAYSVNMADNIMLGSYSQVALSGAATVNQIYFMVQAFAISIGSALAVLAAQYWGKKQTAPIRTLTGISLKLGLIVSAITLIACGCFPDLLLRIFTDSPEIIAEGKSYLMLVMWSFVLYTVTSILEAGLRAVQTVNISFYISIVSLIVNVSINYVLIFGKLGMPEMGIRGAAVGTLIARALELIIILIYLSRVDKKVCLFSGGMWRFDRKLRQDFVKVSIPLICAQVFWSVSVPVQTAILGHLSADAIAANSVATTFYQYLKVIVQAMASVSSVLIGKSVGEGNLSRIRSDAHSLTLIDFLIGVALGMALIALRNPLLSLYSLNEEATLLALRLILVMGFIMIGMSYQMPVLSIFMGGGDTIFPMKVNLISMWCIVIPLSFMSAFWWKLPVTLVVLVIQSDQIFKGLPVFLHFRKYTWIKKLTRDEVKETAAD